MRGAEDFLRLSKALKGAGQQRLRSDLNKALKSAAKPIIPATRQEAVSRLPSRGGLGKLVASEPQSIQVRTGKDPGVRVVVGKRKGGARATERGFVRHPVFFRPPLVMRWVTQQVEPHWFSDAAQEQAPVVRKDLEKALEAIAERIVREARRG